MVLDDQKWTTEVAFRWMLNEYKDYQRFYEGNSLQQRDEEAFARWMEMGDGSCVLSMDGAYKESTDHMGMGGWVRDRNDRWMKGFFLGSAGGSPLRAEIGALKAGLELLRGLDIRVAVCETDCLEIVETLRGDRYLFHALANEFLEVRDLLSRAWNISVRHIPRERNDVADSLAARGALLQCGLTVLQYKPPNLALSGASSGE